MKIVYESSYKKTPAYGDTLMHWKYIKREKKNGRWVYYYDEGDYGEAKKKARDAHREFTNAGIKKSQANILYKFKGERLEMKAKAFNSFSKETASEYRKEAKRLSDDAKAANKRYQEAGKKYIEANKKLKTIKVKTLAARTIAKGVAAVANFFSKLTSKFKK